MYSVAYSMAHEMHVHRRWRRTGRKAIAPEEAPGGAYLPPLSGFEATRPPRAATKNQTGTTVACYPRLGLIYRIDEVGVAKRWPSRIGPESGLRNCLQRHDDLSFTTCRKTPAFHMGTNRRESYGTDNSLEVGKGVVALQKPGLKKYKLGDRNWR